ncbi:phosphonate transport system substrate-binding protein [Mariprofundus micogutta]|uniref:Phosphonate transport system substrate-binding protein n=1 Tax=Mariprofundus micogutta TaxID=1921010 RepID=A0A1L8CMF8_9PROT|nr:PhnD/SsuA/transferrin family substrate-binding protein [Mariprofundus micogutta]GAV20029.1 phosphonate transport system substrate-binding protein [Mariprofundus micogutta]
MRFKFIACAALLILLPFANNAHAAKLAFSGVILDQGNNPVLSDFTDWLSTHGDYPLEPAYTESYQALSDALKKHRNDMAWTCGVPFVEDHARDGQQLVAVPLFRGEATYYSVTVTRAGRAEKKLGDFKAGVLAYSDPRSNSGFVAPAFALQQQGLDINKHFRLLLHTGLHEGSINAVLNGLADVANVDEYILVEYLKSHPQDSDKLVVLERFGPFPFTPIVAGSKTPEDVIKRLQQALVSMHEDAEGKRILDLLGLDGFVIKPTSFYQPVASMLESLK